MKVNDYILFSKMILISLICFLACNNVEYANQKSKNKTSEIQKTKSKKTSFQSKIYEPKDARLGRFQYYDFLAPRCHKMNQLTNTNLMEVQILEIRKENLEQFFEVEKELTNLEALMIVYTQIDMDSFEKLISSLSTKQYFKKLILNHNGLREIPSNISKLKKLITLDLSFQEFKKLPEEITQLSDLTYLRVAKNKSLVELPASLGNLSKLKILEFGGTNMRSIPLSIGELSDLENITGNACQLKSIPEGIGRLRLLKSINLGYNKITAIPSQIGECANLEYLAIDDNSLNEIPQELGNLTKLKSCGLSGNKLKEFPRELLSSKDLISLILHGNNFTSIPMEITELKQLKILYLDANKINKDRLEAIKSELPLLEIKNR